MQMYKTIFASLAVGAYNGRVSGKGAASGVGG